MNDNINVGHKNRYFRYERSDGKKKTLLLIFLLIIFFTLGLAVGYFFRFQPKNYSDELVDEKVTNFEECLNAGRPVMESYPRQCRSAKGEIFTEDIGSEVNKSDLIILSSPRPNDIIRSPLVISGEARGTWFFEASFPVVLTNWDGLIIAEGYATAQTDWMTENFVPFEAVLEFVKPDYGKNGALILQKDNPSGLPEHDNALEIPILFE